MEDKLRRYVEELFNGTSRTKKAVELKEEMVQNLHDKYNDLISEGKTPEAAYNIAVAGIGDVSGLLSELEYEAHSATDAAETEAARRRSAMFTAIAVMIYILSVIPLIVLHQLGGSYANPVGLVVMLIAVAAATGLLVYNNMTKPRIFRGSDTIVEEFREWQTDTRHRKTLRRSISSALWSVLTTLFFIISFATRAWHVTWIIFLVGAAIEAFINIFYSLKK